jgi:hypothetical protein
MHWKIIKFVENVNGRQKGNTQKTFCMICRSYLMVSEMCLWKMCKERNEIETGWYYRMPCKGKL